MPLPGPAGLLDGHFPPAVSGTGQAGLVCRCSDADDARVVRVMLTAKGDRLVTELTKSHLIELYKLAAVLNELTRPGPR